MRCNLSASSGADHLGLRARQVFVTGLPECTEVELIELFDQFGPVDKVWS